MKLGTTAWRISSQDTPNIEGYADAVSVNCGQTFRLFVSTMAVSYRVYAFRMGFYGGLGARLVWMSPSERGGVQPRNHPDQLTGLNAAPWRESLRVTATSSWYPGDYLLKLVPSEGGSSYIPMTVRDDLSRASLLIQNGVTTWEAYNAWGGDSLYIGGRGETYANRARVVTFDRPYSNDTGAGQFLDWEYSFVYFAEERGLDVTYSTDVDLDKRPDLLSSHMALITLGHDEYWSTTMRNGAQSAIDHGVNIAFFGANGVNRHIRFESSTLGTDRIIVNYKVADEDPQLLTNPAESTGDWRDPPLNDPEERLIGEQYNCSPVKADMVIDRPELWIYRHAGPGGTELTPGTRITGLVGYETDRYDPGSTAPRNLEVLADSPISCRGKPDFSDMTYYTASSGAGVFDTGTTWWIRDLGHQCVVGCAPNDIVTRMTENVTELFSAGPAARSVASAPNYRMFRGFQSPRPTSAAPDRT